MIDGPYGGISFDLGRYEHVLLVAGGAGITFTLGVLDDLIGRIVRLGRRGGERTRRVEFAWCIRSFGQSHLQEVRVPVLRVLLLQVAFAGSNLNSRTLRRQPRTSLRWSCT